MLSVGVYTKIRRTAGIEYSYSLMYHVLELLGCENTHGDANKKTR